jgi:hypothetical protein
MRQGGRGEPGSLDPDDYVLLGQAAAAGIDGAAGGPLYVMVQTNVSGLSYSYLQVPPVTIQWSEVERISVSAYTEAVSRALPVALFGVLGLGAKGSKNVSVLTLEVGGGRELVFLFSDITEGVLRARITPTLASAARRLDEARPSEARPAPSTADEAHRLADGLERLADLRDRGVLTDEEFSASKARLLGGRT